MKKTRKDQGSETSGPLMSDVAKLAGVATSTVSRALANPGRVNQKTREKITRAAETLGYTPNAAARNLRVGKSNIILIVLPGPLYFGASQVVPQVLQGIDATLVENGYNLLIANLNRGELSEKHILDLAHGGTVRGAIILSSPLPIVANRSLADAGIPLISLFHDLSSSGVSSVITNDREAVCQAVSRELVPKGHSRFLYIAGPEDNYHEVERYQGLLEALLQSGLSEKDIVISGGTLDYRHGFAAGLQAAEVFLKQETKPTAVVATSDDMAIAFMSQIRQKGWRVPQDVSVVGFDCSPVSAFVEPPLSSIRQPVEDMGDAAAKALLALLSEPKKPLPQRIVLASDLVIRGSIGQAC